MSTEPAYLLHIMIGTLAMLLYWATFSRRKGSRPHRFLGRAFFLSLAAVIASVGGLLFLSGRPYAAPEMVQFAYLAFCVFMVTATAWAAIRLKTDLARFRGAWFKATGSVSFALAVIVLFAGIATHNPLPIVFSIIGLLYGGAMIRFAFMKAPVHPNWPLIWHLNGITFLFNAVHGTALAVAWRAGVDPAAGDGLSVLTQILTMAGSLALRLWFGRRFHAPLRLTAQRQSRVTAETQMGALGRDGVAS